MKKIIIIVFLNLAIISAFFIMGCSKKSVTIPENAIKLVAVQNEERFSNSICTTNEITFKCSLNYQLGIDEETGDFIFCLKDEDSPLNTMVLSCDKQITEADYYSYENTLIFQKVKIEDEYVEIYTDYCKKDCSYAIIFVEDNKEVFYAKFIRK